MNAIIVRRYVLRISRPSHENYYYGLYFSSPVEHNMPGTTQVGVAHMAQVIQRLLLFLSGNFGHFEKKLGVNWYFIKITTIYAA